AYPLALRIVTFLHRKLFIDGKVKRAKKKKKKIDESKLPEPIWPKMRRLLLFAFKDSRGISFKKGGTSPIQRRFVYLGLWRSEERRVGKEWRVRWSIEAEMTKAGVECEEAGLGGDTS